MNQTKAIIDFSGYTSAELGPIAQHIHDELTTHAADFPDPPVTLADFQTLITAYAAALVARESNASADIVALTAAREALEDALSKLGLFVNLVANGDALLVEKSGIASYVVGAAAADTAPPEAPEDLRLRHGTVSGSVIARYRPRRQPSTNEVQITTADPGNEANWQTHGLYQSGRAELTGLTPGVLVCVRVRTVGLRGVMGAWSDLAQIRVV